MLGLLIGSAIIGFVTTKCGYPIITVEGFIINIIITMIWVCLHHILFNK